MRPACPAGHQLDRETIDGPEPERPHLVARFADLDGASADKHVLNDLLRTAGKVVGAFGALEAGCGDLDLAFEFAVHWHARLRHDLPFKLRDGALDAVNR